MANEDSTSNNRNLVWAIVDSGTRRLIGRIAEPIQAPCIVYDAIELSCHILGIPVPVQTPQGTMLQIQAPYQVEGKPVDLEVDSAVNIAVLSIANIRLFSEMADKGEKYRAIYDRTMAAMLQARAQKAGLQLSSQIPKKGGLIDS